MNFERRLFYGPLKWTLLAWGMISYVYLYLNSSAHVSSTFSWFAFFPGEELSGIVNRRCTLFATHNYSLARCSIHISIDLQNLSAPNPHQVPKSLSSSYPPLGAKSSTHVFSVYEFPARDALVSLTCSSNALFSLSDSANKRNLWVYGKMDKN